MQIDNFRKEILLTPLPPARLLELQWKCTQAYLTGWNSLLPSTRPAAAAVKRKSAFDHIRQVWTGTPASVTPGSIARLDMILGTHAASSADTAKLLEYLGSESSHTILQAAIVHLHFAPSDLAFFVPLMFIYRRLYDCHGVVCIDEFWPKNLDTYTSVLSGNQKTAAITQWLEFYCQAAVYQYGLAHRAVLHQSTEISQGIWTLTERQKTILSLLESPSASITNRQVQHHFKISQVTASRDLAKMVSLNLLYTHGKGRSVYYTKI